MFIDDHIGVSIAGLASDARILWFVQFFKFFLFNFAFFSRFMRTECINHQYGFDKPMPVTRLMDHVSKSMNDIQPFFPFINVRSILECQIPTQRYGRRPFGVGFLMAGYDV